MKKFCLFLFLIIATLFSGCKNNPSSTSNELDVILSEIPGSSAFIKLEECDDCKKLDEECEIILGVKKKLDISLISLKKLVMNYKTNAENFSDKTVFTEQIIQMSRLGMSVQDATTDYKKHVEFIQNFMSETPSSVYDNAKKAMASGDPVLSDASIVTELTNYAMAQTSFSGVLTKILGCVSNGDLESAAKELQSNEVYNYYLSTAKMLKSLYVFEESRAISVKKTHDSYRI